MVEGFGKRAVARCDELAGVPYTDTPGQLYRAYLSVAHGKALERVAQWMQEAGMTVHLDAAANLIGRYEAVVPGAPALLIGSHIDSVRDAGSYDGPLGVMLGIECVAALHRTARHLPFAIEVVAFGDEEGSRFPVSMLCSRALAGALQPDDIKVVDAAGISVEAARHRFNELVSLNVSSVTFPTAARAGKDVLGFLEAHIEQGPVLEAEGLALGVVSGIAAQLRLQVSVTGHAGHAGTNAMHLRKDALAGAAEMVLAVESIANGTGGEVVATVGRLRVGPGAVNVVPGNVDFSIDVRSGNQDARDAAATQIIQTLTDIADKRDLQVVCEQKQDLPATPCSKSMMTMLEHALIDAGHKPRTLVSGAGHDTMSMAALCPVAMLFIRCEKGISHNPAENVSIPDVAAALEVMLGFLNRLEKVHHVGHLPAN